jgi:hypothetical protein
MCIVVYLSSLFLFAVGMFCGGDAAESGACLWNQVSYHHILHVLTSACIFDLRLVVCSAKF